MRGIAYLVLFLSSAALNCVCQNVTEPFLETSGSEVADDGTEMTETQHATCRITTEELVANAQATVTRGLTGVCNAKVMDERFQNLEKVLTNQLDVIKEMLITALKQRDDPSGRRFGGEERNLQSPGEIVKPRAGTSELSATDPRREEIDRFNSTIHQVVTPSGPTLVFTYYWRVRRLHEKLLRWESGRSQRTATFHVSPGGYAMYLRLTPRHVPDDTVFINVGLTRGNYDEDLEWPFSLKHRVQILDESPGGPHEDLSSRIWDPTQLCSGSSWARPKISGEGDNPECVGLGIPRHIILSNPSPSSSSSSSFRSSDAHTRFLWDGNLIVKFTVYL